MTIDNFEVERSATITLTPEDIRNINTALYSQIKKDKNDTSVKLLKAKFGLLFDLVNHGMVSGFTIDRAQHYGLSDNTDFREVKLEDIE